MKAVSIFFTLLLIRLDCAGDKILILFNFHLWHASCMTRLNLKDYDVTMKKLLAATSALTLAVGLLASTNSFAAVVLSDNFDADARVLNWSGDLTFTSNAAGSNASTDLIGTGFYDFYPGNGNYVDMDGSTGAGNNPGRATRIPFLVCRGHLYPELRSWRQCSWRPSTDDGHQHGGFLKVDNAVV